MKWGSLLERRMDQKKKGQVFVEAKMPIIPIQPRNSCSLIRLARQDYERSRGVIEPGTKPPQLQVSH